MIEYISVQEIAAEWKMSKRRIQILCKEGRIPEAKMIGNMWVLPKNLKKPFDARRKDPIYFEEKKGMPALRNGLKILLKNMFKKADKIGIPQAQQRSYILSSLSAGLMAQYISGNLLNGDECMKMVYRELENGLFIEEACCLLKNASDFVEKHKNADEIDCIVSWAYQYSNKLHKETKYSNTQFFTEKYMIEHIGMQIKNLKNAEKIVDPSCGGGNFLLECCEIMCNGISEEKVQEHILGIVNKLYGYDIDSGIAKIAVINIKIKAMSILHKFNQNVSLSLWKDITPNIYVSVNDSIGGALEFENGKNKVINIVKGNRKEFMDALGNADVMITNPPFATVKGMDESLKAFLKEKYPFANCDTCAAFMLAMYSLLKNDGQCGIVTQNAWMHLKTFAGYRNDICGKYQIESIVNLGSGAFYDLSGEKVNVSLMVMQKKEDGTNNKKIMYMDLSEKNIEEKKNALNAKDGKYSVLPLIDHGNNVIEFDFSGSRELRELCNNTQQYLEIAVPMQGTSTGNAKELVDYFWKHFGDEDWRLVSKGGGYCRWQGLNSCVVKWGKDGEYIKRTKGSALRNVKYFKETDLVYSDTGTAGLNVRIKMPEQIFVASGPGIRIKKGNLYAQLAYLNSRLATFCIRKASPKLTIAAGYIGRLPICENIYDSVVLEENARLCIELKRKFLKTRPNNIEYEDSYLGLYKDNIGKCAFEWFWYDIKNELLKLEIENQIDIYIIKAFGVSDFKTEILDETLGECAYSIQEKKRIDVKKLDLYLSKLLDDACVLKKTKVSKPGMGNDGLLEYASKGLQVNPEFLVKFILAHSDKMVKLTEKYKNLILHNEVLHLMGYNTQSGIMRDHMPMGKAEEYFMGKYGMEMDLKDWLCETFGSIHRSIFKKYPIVERVSDEFRKVRY